MNKQTLQAIIDDAKWPTSHVDVNTGEFFTYDHNTNKYKPVVDGVILNQDVEVGFLYHVKHVKQILALTKELEELKNQKYYYQVVYKEQVQATFMNKQDADDFSDKYGGVYSVYQTWFRE